MRTFVILLLAVLPVLSKEIQLFNGKDLTGWTFTSAEGADKAEASWSAKDGVLATAGKPIGFIRSEGSYENYTITLEWRWLPGTENGNSGLLLHAGESNGKTWPASIESQLYQNNAGDIWMIDEKMEATGKNEGDRWHRVADPKEKPIGEWNTMTVVCKADTISIHVNGTLVNEGKNLSTTSGNICLQAEGAPIEFRNIVLKK